MINGTSGADSWLVDFHAGVYTVNGSSSFDPLITDVQVNGFDNIDFLDVLRTDVPVVFNGGNGGDLLDLSSFSTANISGVTAPVTYNGGAGTDAAQPIDSNFPSNTAYTVNGSAVQRTGTGVLNLASSVEELHLHTGAGNNSITVSSLTTAANVIVYAGAGGNSMFVDMNTMLGNITVLRQ